MKIVRVEQLHVDGGWDDWSFLKLTTDDGLIGWSEFNQARGRRGLAAVVQGMAELIMGEDPRDVGRLSARLYALTQMTAGGLQALAIGAYENACLDIKAKALGVPVYELFGGALRHDIPVYWSHFGMYRARNVDLFEQVIGKAAVRGLDDLKRLAAEAARNGFKALKTNLLVFHPGKPAAIGRGTGSFELNIDHAIERRVVDQLAALREGGGADMGLMLDLNFNYKTEGFRRLALAAEPLGLTWLEMDSQNPEALGLIRRTTRTPIASMETVLGRRALKPYLDAQAVDVGIVDVVFNGMAESVKMAALLDAWEINVAAHNSHGPLGSLMSAHFCAVIPNLRFMEYDEDEVPWRRHLLTRPWTLRDGCFALPQGPGWGADIQEDVAREHAAKRMPG
ncbi:MAG: mandelate racemase/muconate lactonizing enzyme family protein [Pigmentiphaga sp.]|uniref:mandelate racemase/muconate lactonizing enzyme family protein n=1 Tax=Pigmentiphaga sp. TaxID=1977564 RepID=UPI0029AB58C0|nr:mandelate racemase/muconate lactonizing enzyme family protein [Pigmentiphaga sp.]MDX3905928.1 mandelate racemase/muconate lactonizing enzyme family protein [Pigmentiphaga sp.]